MVTNLNSSRIAEIFRYLVRFAALIGVIISSAVLLYTVLSDVLIPDDEYLIGQSREFQQCETPDYRTEIPVEKTPEEVDSCKKETRERLLLQRGYEQKNTLILTFSRLFVCGLVYGLFVYVRSEEKAENKKRKLI